MMKLGQRPQSGKDEYESDASEHLEALRGLALDDGSPDYNKINEYIKTKRHQTWGNVKPFFMAAQQRKCGFCEVKITESTGDVEHYRPKNAVWTVKNPGSEQEDLVNLRGRSYHKDFGSGYWWLTYSWDNYLVSCPTCNQKWKSAVFPIAQARSGPPVVGDESSETPLLLDPFGTESPSNHLAFDALGQIETYQNSVIGMKTIETCGLDRESLRSDRQEKASRAWRLLKRLPSSNTEAETQEILQDLREMGRIEYAHSGMVRSIFEQSTGMSWSQLEAAGPSV